VQIASIERLWAPKAKAPQRSGYTRKRLRWQLVGAVGLGDHRSAFAAEAPLGSAYGSAVVSDAL
jgi:hypothetical protein